MQDSYHPAQLAGIFQALCKFSTRGMLVSSQGWDDGRTMVGNTRLLLRVEQSSGIWGTKQPTLLSGLHCEGLTLEEI